MLLPKQATIQIWIRDCMNREFRAGCAIKTTPYANEVFQSLCRSVYLSVYLSVYFYLSAYLSMFVCLFSISLCVCLSLSIYLSFSVYFCLYVYFCLSVYFCLFIAIRSSVCLLRFFLFFLHSYMTGIQ
jgi:hypothetical protein